MSAQKGINVAVVGGGIGGVTLALALLKRNINVQLYEKGEKFAEYGAGLGFPTNSVRAMKVAGPSVFEAYDACVVKSKSHNGTSKNTLTYLDAFSEPSRGSFTLSKGEGTGYAHRAEFLDGMTKHLPANVQNLNKNLRTVTEDAGPDAPLTLHFADGSTAQADVVIGADGIGSRVRRVMVGDDHPSARAQYSHKYIYRMILPAEKAIESIGKEKTESAVLWMGHEGRVIAIPISGGKLLSVGAVHHDPNPWPSSDHLILPATKDEVAEDYKDFNAEVRGLLSNVHPNIDRWALFDMAEHPVPYYAKGRMAIIGDAAHATTPHFGVGAGFAIEDAAVLAELLADDAFTGAIETPKRTAALQAVLSAYEAARKERASWLPPASRARGDLYEYMDKECGDDLAKIEAKIKSEAHNIYDVDIATICEEAKQDLHKRLSALS